MPRAETHPPEHVGSLRTSVAELIGEAGRHGAGGATGLAAPGTTRSFGLGYSLREPARPDPGCSQEALQAVSEQIQGSFCELRRWQNDVEATLQKLRAEPRPPTGRGRGESPRGRANSGQPAPALQAPQAGPPVSPTSGRYSEEPPKILFQRLL